MTSWSADPLAEPLAEYAPCCTDVSCLTCQVKVAGARRMVAGTGHDYDALDSMTQLHFRELAGAVMSDMSEAIVTLRIATPKETPDD